MTNFAVKGGGNVYLNLGMQVSRDGLKDALDANQGNYVNTILHLHGCVDSKSVSTPGTAKPLDLVLGTLLDDSSKHYRTV